MHFLTQIKYSTVRSPGRSVLLLLVAAVLVTSIGAYLGNLRATQTSLNNLAESIPVTVRVLNRNGTNSNRLAIDIDHYNALTSLDVHDVLCTSIAAGALKESTRSQEPFSGGDTSIVVTNTFDALSTVLIDELIYLEGYSKDFLENDEAACAISERYAQLFGIEMKDDLVIPVYSSTYSPFGVRYSCLGDQHLRVVAIYPYKEKNGEHSPDMILSVAWLRTVTKSLGVDFCYNSLSVVMNDPFHLTEFKEKLTAIGFTHVSTGEASDAISVEDELFIKTAEELRKNLQLYQLFQWPYYGLISVMLMLTVFLVIKDSRRNIAIACSLGESKKSIFFAYFLSTMLIQLVGSCISTVMQSFFIGIQSLDSLVVLLVYLVCACVGTFLALVRIMKFDVISLLMNVG